VKVEFPRYERIESDWARLAMPMAGAGRGMRFVPEKDDEVLVAFAQGDEGRYPYILGALWSKADKPPAHDGDKVKNNWRYFKSRSGHILRFDDTDGKEKVEIIDKAGKHKITVDTSGDKIEIVCDSGDINIKAESGKVNVKASEVTVESSGDMTLKASGNLKLQGSKVDIN
jgi:uncharacterized protein involved in type VI secretion and phage assembly